MFALKGAITRLLWQTSFEWQIFARDESLVLFFALSSNCCWIRLGSQSESEIVFTLFAHAKVASSCVLSVCNARTVLRASDLCVCVFQVTKLHVAQCEKHLDCHSCLSNRDPYCGWCSLEGRYLSSPVTHHHLLFQHSFPIRPHPSFYINHPFKLIKIIYIDHFRYSEFLQRLLLPQNSGCVTGSTILGYLCDRFLLGDCSRDYYQSMIKCYTAI